MNIEWIALRACIMTQQKNTCAMCGKILNDTEFTLHHIISRTENGKDELDNLIGLCNNCHDIAEDKQLNREEIINYYKNYIPDKPIRKVYASKNNQTEYEYPEVIILHEKYIIKKRKENKYILKYSYNLEEIAKMFRVNISIVKIWVKDSVKEKRLIKMLEGVKKSEDKNICYIL